MKRFKRAVDMFTEALSAPKLEKGNDILYLHERAKSLQMVGNHSDAVADFGAVIRLKNDDDRAYFRRGWSYKAMGLFELAAGDFEKAKSINPKQKLYNLNYRLIGDIETIILLPPGRERKVIFDIEEDIYDDMSSNCSLAVTVASGENEKNLYQSKDKASSGNTFRKPLRKSLTLNDM